MLSGAQAIGDKIVANVGHDLTITSLQDLDNYKSQQMSASGGFSLTFGSMTGSASLSVSKSQASSEYASVGDQSGLFAGNQGFDINVGNHTQLNGAVIASTSEAANNSLSTGTLGWRDIENKADYQSSTVGISGGYAKGLDDNKEATHAGGALPVSINRSGSASGTTYSAIADGTLTVRNQDQQAQDISTLSHDTENANGHISKIFDKDKVEKDQAFSQAVGEAAIQTINNIGQQMQLNAREDAYNKLAGNEQFLKASAEEQARMINADPDYIKAQKSFAIGSPFWTAGTAISGALAGLAGGNTSQMLAGGLAPYLALAVKKATTDENNNVNMPANIAGHALAGAVVAYLQGGSVAGGAAGAAGGELAAHAIMAELYPNSTADSLTSEQKANISALSTLAGALAGGVAGNSSNAIGAGAVAGKVAVENNALRVAENKSRSEEFVRCQGNADCINGVNEKYKKISAEQHESVVNCKGAQDCVDKANEVGKLQADYANRANELKEYARIHGSLTPEQQNELSILEGTSIQLEADRTEAIHRAMMSGDSPEANKLAIDALAQAVGTSAAGIAAGVGKGKTVGEGVTSGVKPVDPVVKPTNEAHNAANYAGLKLDLKTTEAANEAIESLRTTGRLPGNYVNKMNAYASGWAEGKAVNNYVPGGQIGGDIFRNSDGLLPSAPGRTWFEADIGLSNTMSRSNASQPASRLLYSSDGLLYVTPDHYGSFVPVGTWK